MLTHCAQHAICSQIDKLCDGVTDLAFAMDGAQHQIDHMQHTFRRSQSPTLSLGISRAFRDARSAHLIRCALGNMRVLRVCLEITQRVMFLLDSVGSNPTTIAPRWSGKTLSEYSCMACDITRRASSSQSTMAQYWKKWVTTLLALGGSRSASAMGLSDEEVGNFEREGPSQFPNSLLTQQESISIRELQTNLQLYLDIQDKSFDNLQLFFARHVSLLRHDSYAAMTESEVTQSLITWKAASDTVSKASAKCVDVMFELTSTDPSLYLTALLAVTKTVYVPIAASFSVSSLTLVLRWH